MKINIESKKHVFLSITQIDIILRNYFVSAELLKVFIYLFYLMNMFCHNVHSKTQFERSWVRISLS